MRLPKLADHRGPRGVPYAMGEGTIGPQRFDVTDGLGVSIEKKSVSAMHDQFTVAAAAARSELLAGSGITASAKLSKAWEEKS